MDPIEIMTTFGQEELDVTAWILKESKARKIASRLIPSLFGILVIAFGIYYKINGGTVLQLVIIILLGLLCIVRGIMADKWPLDRSEKATRLNSDLVGRKIRYIISDDGIESTSYYGTGSIPWDKVKSYGEKDGMLYIIVKGGQAIILKKDDLDDAQIEEIKGKLLDTRSNKK